MYILGINAFHGDSSACIYRDGELIMAIEEERLRRIKHWAGLPTEAIGACLADAGITLADVDHIAISRDPSARRLQKIMHVAFSGTSMRFLRDRFKNKQKFADIRESLMNEFKTPAAAFKAKIHNVEHHRAHLASAFFASPFEEAALLSIDGMGDFSSLMRGRGKGKQIEVFDTVNYPHSAGIFYTAFTQYLGFPHYGDEYKVMGLAPYGNPTQMDKVRDVILTTPDGLFKLNKRYFNHPKNGVKMSWDGGRPEIGSLFSAHMEEVFGKARKGDEPLTQYHKDIAVSVQRRMEEVLFHLLNHLHKKTGLDAVCIAGGVGQNSVANGKILLNTPFKKVYLPPAAHDAGTSMGAALWVYNQVLGNDRLPAMYRADLGSKFKPEQIEAALNAEGLAFEKLDEAALVDKVSDCLINSGVVGWFQGRAEFGPRALGFRSILADPRRTDARELLNLKIKKRESFRPFAPSILKEYAAEYFEQTDDVPFMEKVFMIREEKRAIIPAVTHVDGTGRLQTVEQAHNPRYHALITAFHKKTGVPVVLNTSFNENEPIVNTPQEALACYLRTQMDMIVLDNYVVTRKP